MFLFLEIIEENDLGPTHEGEKWDKIRKVQVLKKLEYEVFLSVTQAYSD